MSSESWPPLKWDGGPDPDDDDDGDEEPFDEQTEEQFQLLEELLKDLGPAAVLEIIGHWMYLIDRPFHRIAKKVLELAAKTGRTIGAVEEAKQTRGIEN